MYKVKNLKSTVLSLAQGDIPPGGLGYATRAETETLSQYLEVIQNGKEKEITETSPDADDAEPGQETLLRKRGRPRNV